MRPDAILFDAGGTLVLQDPSAMARRLGIDIDPGRAFEAHYRTMAEFSALKLAGDDATWDWWLTRYFTILGHPEPGLAGPAIDRGLGLWHWAIPGVPDVVAALTRSGVRAAVVSNSDGSVEGSLAAAGFSGVFELIVDSEVVGVKKPDPAIFHLALDRLGLTPDRVWYVGDSVFHDVHGARAAGIARALLVDPLDLHPDIHDRIRSVAELAV